MTDALSIIKALGGDHATGMCCCPAHDDKRASLHISEKSGRVLWKCHAGCSQERLRQALIDKGLWSKKRTTTRTSSQESQQSDTSAREEARKEANRIWKEAKPAWERHAYCKRKGVNPTGLKMERRDSASPLLVPVYDEKAKLVNIHFIHTDGSKHYIKGCPSKDCHYWIAKPSSLSSKTICICEGWATGASAHAATKYAVAMTFGKANLLSGAKWVRKKYPDQKIILLADDDGGDGIAKASEAAQAVNGLVAIPKFGPGPKKYGKDFNDLQRSINYEGVKHQIDNATKPDAEEPDEDAGEPVNRKQVDSLVELAADAELFHTSDLVGYADMTIDGHRETWPIKSKGFRSWLLHQYYRATGSAPSGEALRLAIETLDAKARYDGPTLNIYLRVGGDGDKIYIDLCDKEWRAVEIDRNGWRVVSRPPIRFRRAPGMLSLPTPVKGGSIDDLRPFVNVKGSDFVLLVSFIVAALRDRGPYPGLALKGEEGSAKSTLAKLTRDLIDPHKVRARSLPRENRDLHIAANASHVIAFDNVSQIPDWLSDALCSLATGGGFATRALYTDMDEILFEAVRPVVLNGIEYATRSDLADRLIFLNLPPITDDARFTEREFWAQFEAARPSILGVLCDAIARGLRRLPYTPAENLPRMADFAQWSVAWEGALFEPGSFMKAYARNRKGATLDVIENDDVAVAVRKLMTRQDEWSGTATELLHVLGKQVGEKIEKSKEWPASAKSLGSKLKRAAKTLRKIGIVIDKMRRSDSRGTRAIVIYRQHDKVRTKTSETSALSEPSKIKPFKNRGSDNADKSDKFIRTSRARRQTEKG